MNYLIKSVRLAKGDLTDLRIVDGVVAEVGPGLRAPGAEVVDADGLIALPGLVDLHTHLREPGREDAETVESGLEMRRLYPVITLISVAELTQRHAPVVQ